MNAHGRVAAVLLGLAALFSTHLPVRAAIEDPARDALAAQAENAMWWGDFERLERLYLAALRGGERNAWNGRTPLQSVRSGYVSVFKYDELNGAYFREIERLTAAWAQARPQSALAQLLHARALHGLAWHVRGEGYWQDVPEHAQEEFIALIGRAGRYLVDRAPMLAQHSTMHLYLLMIGRAESWPLEQQLAIAQEGAAREAADAFTLYEELVTSMLPKWSGSWELVANFIEQLDRQTMSRGGGDGHELYAQLWSAVAGDLGDDLFDAALADWPRVKSGFMRLADKFADPWYRTRLAYLACVAKDRATLRSAIARLGTEVAEVAWRGGGQRPQHNRERCQQWATAGG